MKPSCSSWSLNTVAVSEPGDESSPTIVMSQFSSHLPELKPAFFMYSAASFGSPFGFWMKSRSGPATPPASSNPGKFGMMKWVATGPTSSPPRVFRRSVRFEAAITALRTLMSSNGGSVVFSAM